MQNHPPESRPRIDIPGVLLACGGLFALVYGFSNAETHSWTAPLTIVSLAASVVLLAAFVAVERRRTDPLLPLHIVRDRARGGAYLSILLAGAGVFAVFLFLTYYMQENLGFSPIKTGLSFLPLTAALVVTSTTVQTKLLYRTGAKPLVAAGMTLGLIAMLLLTRLSPGAGYTSHVLPALVITGLGMGCIFAPAFSTATLGIDSSEAGVASAMVNTSQQVGGSVGTALLSTIFASATAAYASSHAGTPGVNNAATIHGYTTAFAWAAGIFALGLLVALLDSSVEGQEQFPGSNEGRGTRNSSRVEQPALRATAILVTGPCCHFAVTVHIEHDHAARPRTGKRSDRVPRHFAGEARGPLTSSTQISERRSHDPPGQAASRLRSARDADSYPVGSGTISTGRCACAESPCETLPSRVLRIAPRPRWPQTISPASIS